MKYIIEGINSKGILYTASFTRMNGKTTEQSAEWAAGMMGIQSAYSWYPEDI